MVAVKALWIVLVTEGTPTNWARTVVSVSAAAAAAKPKNVLSVDVVVETPGSGGSTEWIAVGVPEQRGPDVDGAGRLHDIEKAPDGQAPGSLAAIGVLATPQRAL